MVEGWVPRSSRAAPRARDLAQDGPGAILPSAVGARGDHRYDVHGRLSEATGRTHRALLPKDAVPSSAGTIHSARPVSLNDRGALDSSTSPHRRNRTTGGDSEREAAPS
jgi:hypothetical protein